MQHQDLCPCGRGGDYEEKEKGVHSEKSRLALEAPAALWQERLGVDFGAELHWCQCWLCQDPSLGTGQGWPGQEAALGAGLGSGGHLPAQGPPCMEEFRHREVNVTAELQKTEPLTRTQAGGYFFPQGLTIS